MSARAVDISELCPIVNIENDLLINGNGDVTVGINLMQPPVYTFDVADYNRTHEALISAMITLRPGTIIQKQEFYYVAYHESKFKEYDRPLIRENKILYNQRPVLRNYSRIYITFTTSSRIKRSQVYWVTPLRWLGNDKFSLLSKVETDIENSVQGFINNINSLRGFKAQRMNNEQLGCAIYDYFNLSYDRPSLEYDKIKNLKIPEICIDRQSMIVGGNYIAVVTMKTEGNGVTVCQVPQTQNTSIYGNDISYNNEIELPQSMVFPLGLGMPVNHILNTVIEIQSNDDIIKYLNAEKGHYNIGKTFKHANSIAKQSNIEAFVNGLVEGNLRACITNVNVIFSDPDPSKIENYSNIAISSMSGMRSAQGWREVEDTFYSYSNSSPGSGRMLHREFISTIDQSICYFHVESQYTSDKEGIVFVDRFGEPCVVNMLKGLDNPHKVIVGTTGAGKSYLINNMVTQCLNQGNNVFIIDIGHSYRRNGKFENATYFDSSDINTIRLNPFLCKADEHGNYLYKWVDVDEGEKDNKEEGQERDVINKVKTIISVIWKGDDQLKGDEENILEDMIENFYEYINKHRVFPKMDSFYDFITYYENNIINEKRKRFLDFESLRLGLEKYKTGGSYGWLLNAEENVDLMRDKFVIFDMEHVSKHDKKLFSIYTVVIIDIILQKISNLKGVNKTIVIDEALDFLMDPKMGFFIAYLYRTARKKKGEVYIATQDSSFFKGLPELVKSSILRNCETKIILDYKESNESTGEFYRDLLELGFITERQLPFLKSLKKTDKWREFLLIMGQKTMVFRNEVSTFTGLAYSSKEEDVMKIEENFKRTGNLAVAIREYEEEKYQKN